MSLVTRGLGQPESPLSTAGLGVSEAGAPTLRAFARATASATANLSVQSARGLAASVSSVCSVLADLSVAPAVPQAGGRKKRKKDPNPLVRIQIGFPKEQEEQQQPVEEVVLPQVVEPEIELLPVAKVERPKVQAEEMESAKRQTDKLLKKVAKQRLLDDQEEQEQLLAMLLLLED